MISLAGVSKLYNGKRQVLALDAVDLEIARGEMVSIVGPSGSGKSTLLNLIGGLDRPTKGEIRIDGRSFAALADDGLTRLRREKIGIIFQFFNLLPSLTCVENVALPLHLKGIARREAEARARELLGLVQLGHRTEHLPDELSGGERQRVAIARALAANPKLMLCDEILSALDVSVQADILDLLRALQAEHGLSYLFISHDLAVVRSLAHHVGVLYRGEMVEFGAGEEVFAPPFHPYTHVLLSAIPEIEREEAPGPIVKSEAAPISTEGQTACPFADRCPWKAGRVCDEVKPPWQATSATHAVRCHIPLAELGERETWSRRIKGVLQDEQTAQPGATADR